MPRHVRNFWIEVSADGVQPVATGPRSGDGGARVIIRQRSNGEIDEETITVECRPTQDGQLVIIVTKGDDVMFSKTTYR
jgi:hypothetical protein